ncbi:MAG: hypothetical protein R3330_17825 [Saprospiraceae bacterium]|nr:hypothetical protein [Saprospiraceae bacterium]
MNKEMVLGFTGVAATVLVAALALGVFRGGAEKLGSVDEELQRKARFSSVEMREAGKDTQSVSKLVNNSQAITLHGTNNAFQNCFVSLMSTMCKVIPGSFNGSMVCPTNFHRVN